LAYGEALVERLRARIQASAARVIYAPSPWEFHPDHLALSLAATEAMRRLGGERTLALYEVGAPLQPNRLLDLGPYLNTKQRAMACFASQLAVQRYDRHIDGLNRFRAYTLGPDVEAAEAFLVSPAEALRDGGLRAFHASPAARRLARGGPVDAADQPLVSIICRTMGRPEFADAVASVAMQTYPNIELIVVDAAARGLELEPWCGRFPQRAVGGGQPLARSAAGNAGLDAARGEYCLFLDEDDWIDPDHVGKLADALRAHRSAPAACTDVMVVDRQGAPTGFAFDSPFDAFRLLTENFMPIHGVLFSRSRAGGDCRLDETLEVHEDWDLWLRLAARGDFARVAGTSAYYRQGGTSEVGGAATGPPDATTSVRIRDGALAVLTRALTRLPPAALRDLLVQGRDRLAQARARQTESERAHAVAITELKAGADRALNDANRDLEMLRNRLAWLEARSAELERVYASTPWRLTAPYRALVRQLNRVGVGIRRDVGKPGAANRKRL
jgi:hypothetical protein